jgi:hypothetical protein
MRRSKAWLSREKTEGEAQVRALIGRQLLAQYDVTQPLPDRLVDLLRTIEQSNSKVCGLQTGGGQAVAGVLGVEDNAPLEWTYVRDDRPFGGTAAC